MKRISKLLFIAAGIRIFLFLGVTTVLFEGCKKSTSDTTTTVSKYANSLFLFQENAKGWEAPNGSSYCDTCVANNCVVTGYDSIILASGTVIYIPPHAFVTDFDQSRPWNNINLRFKEIYKNSDLIFNNIETIDTNFRILRTREMLLIDAGPGIILDTHNNMKMKIYVPYRSGYSWDDSLRVSKNSLDSLNPLVALPSDQIVWWLMDTARNPVKYPITTHNNPQQYIFLIDSMKTWWSMMDSGWWYAPHAANYPTTTITLQNATSPSYSDVQIFAVFDHGAVVKARPKTKGSTTYTINNVPLNITGTIVAWCVSSGQVLYSSIMPIGPVTANYTKTIIYTPQTNSDSLITAIKKLD